MRELAVQAANGSNSASDTSLLNQEFGQLQTEVARIQGSTTFNNVSVFTASDTVFQIGANTTANDRVNSQGTALTTTMALGTQTITDRAAASAGADILTSLTAASTTAGTITGTANQISFIQNAAIDAINASQKVSFTVKADMLTAVNAAVAAGPATFGALFTTLTSATANGITGTGTGAIFASTDNALINATQTVATGQSLALKAIEALDNAFT
jgi:flagellin